MSKKKEPEAKIRVVKLPKYRRVYEFENNNYVVTVYDRRQRRKLYAEDVFYVLSRAADDALYRE